MSGTKRRRIAPRIIHRPIWAQDLLEGVRPRAGTEAYDGLVGWRHFHDQVAGLPAAYSDEGRALLARARLAPRRRQEPRQAPTAPDPTSSHVDR
jgi:hypothetical protein